MDAQPLMPINKPLHAHRAPEPPPEEGQAPHPPHPVPVKEPVPDHLPESRYPGAARLH